MVLIAEFSATKKFSFLKLSLFCATFSILSACLFYLSRFGLDQRYEHSLYGMVGLSLILCLCPLYCIKQKQAVNLSAIYYNDTIFPLYATGFIIAAQFLLVGNHSWLNVFLLVIGGVLYLHCLVVFILTMKFTTILLSGCGVAFFTISVCSVYWSLIADPLFAENIAIGRAHVDTLFHSSLSQMIKTYGVPSTGLDSIPTVQYHFGVHYLIAFLSRLLSCSVVEFYLFGYIIVIFPMMLRAMLSFVVTYKTALLGADDTLNFWFWFLFAAPFIGFISFDGDSLALRSGLGYQTIVYSESYCASLMLLFTVLTCAIYLKIVAPAYPNKIRLAISSAIVFGILFWITGLTKISTLFVLCGIAGYIFLRTGIFRHKTSWITFAALIVASLSALIITNDSKDNEGSFYLFQFINEVIESPFYLFVIFYYVLVHVLIFAFLKQNSIRNKNELMGAIQSEKTLSLEIVVVSAIIGFLPGAVLRFNEGNAHYFSEIQYWLAAALLLVYLHPLVDISKMKKAEKLRIALSIGFLIFVGYNMNKNYGIYYRRTVDKIMNERIEMLELEKTNRPVRLNLIRMIRRGQTQRKDSLLSMLGPRLQAKLDSNRNYQYVNKLMNLDTLDQVIKKNSAIMFTDSLRPTFLQCYEMPFLIPALTGIQSIENLPRPDCIGAVGYAYELYFDERYQPVRNKTSKVKDSTVNQILIDGSTLDISFSPKRD